MLMLALFNKRCDRQSVVVSETVVVVAEKMVQFDHGLREEPAGYGDYDYDNAVDRESRPVRAD